MNSTQQLRPGELAKALGFPPSFIRRMRYNGFVMHNGRATKKRAVAWLWAVLTKGR